MTSHTHAAPREAVVARPGAPVVARGPSGGRHRRPAPVRRRGPRPTLLAKIVLSGGLLVVLVVRAGPGRLAQALLRLDVPWVVLGLALGVAAAVLQANQLRGLLVAFGVPLRLGPVLRIDTAGRLFDAVLPTNIGGDVVRLTMLGRRPGTRVGAAVSVLLRRVVSVPGLVLLLGLGCALSARLDYAGRAVVLGLCCLGAGSGVVALLVTAGRVNWAAVRWAPGPVRRITRAVLAARATGVGPSWPLARAGLRGLAFWTTVAASQGCYIVAAGIHPPPGYAVLVVACVNAASMVPISLGGYGLREGAFGVLLSAGGLGTASQGASVGICLSCQTLLFGLVGGLVHLQLSGRLPSRSEPATPPAPALPEGGPTEGCVPCPGS